MAIKRIQVSNFKSFKELNLELGMFNVLIGANASGKSNFTQIFKFFTNMLTQGLDNAISLEGGAEYLRNINIGSSKDFSFRIVFDIQAQSPIGNFVVRVFEEIYEFAIKFTGESDYEISEDKLILKCHFFRPPTHGENIETIGEGDIILRVVKRKINVDLSSLPDEISVSLTESDIVPQFWIERELPSERFLLQIPVFILPPLQMIFGSIPIYDFDPQLSKDVAKIAGKAELEEDGRNLSLVLKNIKKNDERAKALGYHIRDIFPYIDNIDVKVENKSLLFKVHEIYFKEDLPAFLISDGTINLIAIIIALFFEETKLVAIFEEPERNIHPYLIYELTNLMKDASQNKQIIITTHNPEILKHVNLKDLLLVSRDDEGYSTISRPSEKQEVVKAVKEMGIDELYVQKLLEL